MIVDAPHPLQPFWDLAAAPIQARALELALMHRLFDRLTPQRTAAEVAGALGLDMSATAAWLDLLWSMGLLTRRAPVLPTVEAEFGVAALTARYFQEDSATSCAQAWQYRAGMLARVATQMETLLCEGPPPRADTADRSAGAWAQAARVQIGQEQRAIDRKSVV